MDEKLNKRKAIKKRIPAFMQEYTEKSAPARAKRKERSFCCFFSASFSFCLFCCVILLLSLRCDNFMCFICCFTLFFSFFFAKKRGKHYPQSFLLGNLGCNRVANYLFQYARNIKFTHTHTQTSLCARCFLA